MTKKTAGRRMQALFGTLKERGSLDVPRRREGETQERKRRTHRCRHAKHSVV
jgi:hypothetical protein